MTPLIATPSRLVPQLVAITTSTYTSSENTTACRNTTHWWLTCEIRPLVAIRTGNTLVAYLVAPLGAHLVARVPVQVVLLPPPLEWLSHFLMKVHYHAPSPSSVTTKDTLLIIIYVVTLLFVGCLTSQQHTGVSQGRICLNNCTPCHAEIEDADQTFYLTQLRYTTTEPTGADSITPGVLHGSHLSDSL